MIRQNGRYIKDENGHMHWYRECMYCKTLTRSFTCKKCKAKNSKKPISRIKKKRKVTNK